MGTERGSEGMEGEEEGEKEGEVKRVILMEVEGEMGADEKKIYIYIYIDVERGKGKGRNGVCTCAGGVKGQG